MEKKNKILIGVLLVLILALCFKSFILDAYRTSVPAELVFMEKVEKIMSEKYKGTLYDYHLLTARLVKISEMNEREKTVKDKDGNIIEVKGVYKAKIRKYILGVLPYSEERILDINLDETSK